MNTRTLFADALNNLGSNANLSANECERFGMTWGCKPDCPVFERGECKDCFYETIEMFIVHKEIDNSEAEEILERYDSKLSEIQKTKLSQLITSL